MLAILKIIRELQMTVTDLVVYSILDKISMALWREEGTAPGPACFLKKQGPGAFPQCVAKLDANEQASEQLCIIGNDVMHLS
jgi:hypothetical protein